ncbi:EF-hand domain-containing protein [Candidatus Parabeggiatoa sp. HSG14]|uniref:EF-hand domain-containing protein n=1 Tax=Candidatus Parabeggiatoa sp. HSG14 TaxID=3055593 RepID=UPI0025A76CEB|nr:EF-hand domain-containing protein [Thiotrichales bacterium HSG14]
MKTITMLSTAIALSLSTQICLAQKDISKTDRAERQQARAEKMMARFDINEDGQITQDEVKSQRTAKFKQTDTDGNGILSFAEFKAFVKKNRKQQKRKANEPDGNSNSEKAENGRGDGENTKQNKRKNKKNRPKFRFKRLDSDKNKQLSLEEFVNIRLFDKFDANEDGVLTVEELIQKRRRRK